MNQSELLFILRIVCDYFFPRAALFASSLMQRTMATRTKVTVIYATETGKSETLANNLCSLFNCAFNTKVRKPKSSTLNGGRCLAGFISLCKLFHSLNICSEHSVNTGWIRTLILYSFSIVPCKCGQWSSDNQRYLMLVLMSASSFS